MDKLVIVDFDTNSARDVPNLIQMYTHCRECLREKPSGISPKDWAHIEVGMTESGIQVWCLRHDVNIALFTILIVGEVDDDKPERSGSTEAP